MGCNCGKPKCDGHCNASPAVLQINNPSECVLFHKVEIPASMGNEITIPPKPGLYKNVLLHYGATGNAYFYSSDGIPTPISCTDYARLTNKPSINGVMLAGDKSSSDLGMVSSSDLAAALATKADLSSLATVATSGSYNDLLNKPTIPTVNNATLTIQKNGTDVQTFTANQSTDATANIVVPTATSGLTNDGSDGTSTYVEADDLATVATTGAYSDLTGTPTIPTQTSELINDSGFITSAPKLVDLTDQIQTEAYHRSVIALCGVSTSADTELNSWSSGRIVLHRTNGLSGVVDINVDIENQYSAAYYTNISYLANVGVIASNADIDTATGFRPCTFKYNDVYYGGIELYISVVNLQHAFFTGVGNFDVFGLDYYSTSTNSALNAEVYNSIDFTQFNKTTNTWTS